MMYGLDIGGTKMELAIFDDQLNLETSWRVPTPKQDYQEFLGAIKAMVDEADRKTGQQGSVGIGLPGFVDSRGCGVVANIACINGKPLAEDVSQQLSRPVGFANDAKAFVLSEANGGGADGAKHALGVVLGTGVAGGLCINGELYQGKQNIAGEFGHIPLSVTLQQRYNLPMRQCGCGEQGCMEQYLAGPGLLWMVSHFGGDYASVPELMEGVRAKEAKAVEIFGAYIDCLGSFIARLTLVFDPDVIVLGGGLSNVPEIYQQLPTAIPDYLFAGVLPPPVVAPKFGDSSGVRGAALLGRQAMNTAESDND